MNQWANTSHLIHAVASEPNPKEGYKRVGVAVPPYAHCVDPVRLRSPHNDTWLLFHNGDGMSRGCAGGSPDCTKQPIQWLADCSEFGNGTTPDGEMPGHPAPPLPKGFVAHNAVHQSSGPDGPWQAPPAAATTNMPQCDCPAVHVLGNGSVAMWCQPLFNYPPNDSADQPRSQPIFINQVHSKVQTQKERSL